MRVDVHGPRGTPTRRKRVRITIGNRSWHLSTKEAKQLSSDLFVAANKIEVEKVYHELMMDKEKRKREALRGKAGE